MHENTVLLVSGIIEERSQDVVDALNEHGFCVIERALDNGWCAMAVKKA